LGPPWFRLLSANVSRQNLVQLPNLLHWWHIAYCLASWPGHIGTGLLLV
jgi:hypothetical protein